MVIDTIENDGILLRCKVNIKMLTKIILVFKDNKNCE